MGIKMDLEEASFEDDKCMEPLRIVSNGGI
jgi:hypothetical protein